MLLVLKWTGPTKFKDHQSLGVLAALASCFRLPPNQACLGEGEAQHLTDHPHLPLRTWVSSTLTTPVPFPHPLCLPASRLRDAEKLTSQHVFRFDFANTALYHLPSLPVSIHFLSCCPSSFPVSGSPMALGPLLQSLVLMVFLPEANLSLAHGFGVPLGLPLTSTQESTSPFRVPLPLTLGTAVSRSYSLGLSKAKSFCLSESTEDHALLLSTPPHTQAPPEVPHEAHGCRTPLMRDPVKELPPEAMKLLGSLGNRSWTSEGPPGPGTFSAQTLSATQLTPSNSELQGASAWSIGRDKLQDPTSQGRTLWT